MALTRITKVGGNSLEDPLNFTGGINAVGVVTASTFNGTLTGSVNTSGIVTATGGMQAIGIFSGGTAVHTGVITALNFVGTGNTFVVHNNRVDISISGGAGGASIVYDSTVFAYDNVIDSSITIAQPFKTAAIYTDPDVTVDIESGVQVSVDSGCILNIIDI